MSGICWVNGEFMPETDAKISIFDRGLLFGDAIYEVVRVQNGRMFRVNEHYARMRNSLAGLGIPLPLDAEAFANLCAQLVEMNGIRSGTVYLQTSRGAERRSHVPSKNLAPNVFGFTRECVVPNWHHLPDGVTAVTQTDERWGHCNIKTTMLLPNIRAKIRAIEEGAFETLLISPQGFLTEGCSTNAFAVVNGVIRTHPTDRHILPGVTRALAVELARREGIPIEERAVTKEELMGAEEVFLTGTTTDIAPVIRIDGQAVGNGKAGSITSRLQELYNETLEAETR